MLTEASQTEASSKGDQGVVAEASQSKGDQGVVAEASQTVKGDLGVVAEASQSPSKGDQGVVAEASQSHSKGSCPEACPSDAPSRSRGVVLAGAAAKDPEVPPDRSYDLPHLTLAYFEQYNDADLEGHDETQEVQPKCSTPVSWCNLQCNGEQTNTIQQPTVVLVVCYVIFNTAGIAWYPEHFINLAPPIPLPCPG